jgi:hypothetical protein
VGTVTDVEMHVICRVAYAVPYLPCHRILGLLCMGIFLNTCRDTVQEHLVQVHMIASTMPLKNNVKTLKIDTLN